MEELWRFAFARLSGCVGALCRTARLGVRGFRGGEPAYEPQALTAADGNASRDPSCCRPGRQLGSEVWM